MSTIKSSDEHLTLNADGSSKDIKFQANGVEKASISSSGAFTSTTIDATKLTGDLPAISGANLTGVGVAGISSSADATAITIDSSERVGIGSTSPLAKLDISGNTDTWAGMSKIFLTDTATNSGSRNWSIGNGGTGYGDLSIIYSNAKGGVPADSTGTAALKIDSTGVVTKPLNPAFASRYNSGQTGNWNGEWFIPNNTTSVGCNVGSHYNTSNGRFTAPVAGSYFFSFGVRIDSRGGDYFYIDLMKNGTMMHRQLTDEDNSYDNLFVAGVIAMAANDYVQAKIITAGDTSSTVTDESSWSGFLIG